MVDCNLSTGTSWDVAFKLPNTTPASMFTALVFSWQVTEPTRLNNCVVWPVAPCPWP